MFVCVCVYVCVPSSLSLAWNKPNSLCYLASLRINLASVSGTSALQCKHSTKWAMLLVLQRLFLHNLFGLYVKDFGSRDKPDILQSTDYESVHNHQDSWKKLRFVSPPTTHPILGKEPHLIVSLCHLPHSGFKELKWKSTEELNPSSLCSHWITLPNIVAAFCLFPSSSRWDLSPESALFFLSGQV